ncbi:hypothetical protein JMJ35_000637 [Cladonia borealis]|uniref:Nuclease S1 n=1 Tax=Cladonia borealis TaxID=184061 RepID=A0AA39V5X9_9LECA|nr:hypothetical protein JMJ35_000637 [Cladonia borealis]
MHTLTPLPILLSLLLSTPSALAWGVLGHATIATIAQNYLTPTAQTYVSSILGQGITMASIASWADQYRETRAGRFSEPFHFIDAHDSPPTNCSISLSRDCGTKGCVVSAISNYTSRIQDPSLPSTERTAALKFLIHFLGDITQPLHDEAFEVGGNDISVTWDGEETNLHACWDTKMVEKLAGGENSSSVLEAFAGGLIGEIDNGTYSSEKDSWISCVDVSPASGVKGCAVEWATDANALNCVYVLVGDESGVELDGAYYEGAREYLGEQIAKGGYRLGAFLNGLAAAAAEGGKGELEKVVVQEVSE